MATIPKEVKANIIRKLLKNENYRDEVVYLLDANFFDDIIEFLKNIFNAKKVDKTDPNWYKKLMTSSNLAKEDIAWNSGLNLKTISNIHQTGTKEKVIEVSAIHIERLIPIINTLIESEDLDLELTITINKEKITLSASEMILILNAISVRRAGIRGGLWSTAGKQVEKPLMRTICRLLKVPSEHFDQSKKPTTLREIDFHLFKNKENFRCEVKLMGRGNPESADVVDWRETKVLVADRLSDTNKLQLTQKNVEWIAMHDGDTLGQFEKVLKNLAIPHTHFSGDLDSELEKIINKPDF